MRKLIRVGLALKELTKLEAGDESIKETISRRAGMLLAGEYFEYHTELRKLDVKTYPVLLTVEQARNVDDEAIKKIRERIMLAKSYKTSNKPNRRGYERRCY